MDIVGTVNIELWAVVLGATDALLNLEMPYGYVLKHLKLKEQISVELGGVCITVEGGTPSI